MKILKFAILGAGAGGQTMAAVLSSKAIPVRLYDIDQVKIDKINALGRITVTGRFECEGFPDLVTTDLEAAMRDVDVIMVTTTTDAHRALAEQCIPFLHDGQILMLNPGHVGGALEVSHIIRDVYRCKANIIIAEAGDLMYACRSAEPGSTFQSGIKSRTEVATIPAGDIAHLMGLLKPIFPNLMPANNVLETSFEGGGAMLHPIPSLMNIVHTDTHTPYDYYMEGITPSIAKLVSACDAERLAVCQALGLKVPSLVKSLQSIYGLHEDDLYDLLQHNKAYVGVKSPMDLNHRFIIEDTLCGIMPLSSVGNMLGIKTPIMDAFINIACVICGRDFRAEGRSAESLGMAGKNLNEIFELVS